MQRDVFKRIFSNRRRTFSLRMAPMIDVIFLLLLFFIVAAKWRPQENFLPFKLPSAHAGQYQPGKAEPLEIFISATGQGCKVQIGNLYSVAIGDQNIEADLAVLMEKLESCLLSQRRIASDPVEIVCGDEVRWQHLAKIYNMFFGAGLTDITFRMTN